MQQTEFRVWFRSPQGRAFWIDEATRADVEARAARVAVNGCRVFRICTRTRMQ